MSAREIFLPRYAHGCRGTGKGMDIRKIQSGTGLMVKAGLHRLPEHIFPVGPYGSERLGGHTLLAVNVRCTGRLFHKEAVFRLGAVG